MTLLKLNEAIRPQFIWQKVERRKGESEDKYLQRKEQSHKYYIDEERQHHKWMALFIFVGLSYEYCIGEGRVIDFLEISEYQYSYCLGKYRKYLKRVKSVQEKGKKIDINQPYGRMFIKLGLVRNYLSRF
jgi:hypothetical protein